MELRAGGYEGHVGPRGGGFYQSLGPVRVIAASARVIASAGASAARRAAVRVITPVHLAIRVVIIRGRLLLGGPSDHDGDGVLWAGTCRHRSYRRRQALLASRHHV